MVDTSTTWQQQVMHVFLSPKCSHLTTSVAFHPSLAHHQELVQGSAKILTHLHAAVSQGILIKQWMSILKTNSSHTKLCLHLICQVVTALLESLTSSRSGLLTHQNFRPGLAHSEAELRIVLEERVGPGGTWTGGSHPTVERLPKSMAFALGIHGVREGWVGAAPNGGAPGGIGNDQTFSKELSHQLHMRRLTTAFASSTFRRSKKSANRGLDQ